MKTQSPVKILLVDDDADFIEMNKAVLEQHGYQVLTAYNGKECMEKAEAEKPSLILLDVMMTSPTEGFHVIHALRKSKVAGAIPVLMVTSVHESVPYKFEPDADWLPVDAFIEKPITPQRLLEEVRKRLPTS